MFYEVTNEAGQPAYIETSMSLDVSQPHINRIAAEDFHKKTKAMKDKSDALTKAKDNAKIEVDPLVAIADLEAQLQQLKKKLKVQ